MSPLPAALSPKQRSPPRTGAARAGSAQPGGGLLPSPHPHHRGKKAFKRRAMAAPRAGLPGLCSCRLPAAELPLPWMEPAPSSARPVREERGGPEGWGRHGAGPRVTAAAAVGNAHARIHEQQHLSRSGSCHRRENTMVSKNGTRARLEATATCNSPAGGCTLHVWMPCRYVACADVKAVGKVHLSVCPCGILHISTYRCNRSLGKALTPTHKHAWGDFPTPVQISISLDIPHICSSFLEDPSAHLPPWMEISPTDRKKHACVSGAGELATAQPPDTKGDTCFETTKGITCPIHRKHT